MLEISVILDSRDPFNKMILSLTTFNLLAEMAAGHAKSGEQPSRSSLAAHPINFIVLSSVCLCSQQLCINLLGSGTLSVSSNFDMLERVHQRTPNTPRICTAPFFTRPQLGPCFVLKFVRSRGFGSRFLQPFAKSLLTAKCYSNTKMAVNSRKWPLIAVNGR